MRRIFKAAYADIAGSFAYGQIKGRVVFRNTDGGVYVNARIVGLPKNGEKCGGDFLGFHIHEGGSCTGTESDPFEDTMAHYNPNGCTHPYHAGDMPPLLNADGMAVSAFLTNRFKVSDIIGKTVVIHSGPDDFTTQPSGNSGIKIACGVIRAAR